MGYDITLGLTSKEDIDAFANGVLSVDESVAEATYDPATDKDNKDAFLQALISDAVGLLANQNSFNGNVGFILAQYLSSLDTSWYLRGTSYSGMFRDEGVLRALLSNNIVITRLVSSWQEVLPKELLGEQFANNLTGGYSIGCILAPEKVTAFLEDYKNLTNFRDAINTYTSHNIFVMLDALLTAQKEQKYMVEATDLVQPPPDKPGGNPEFYMFDVRSCRPEGAILYKCIAEAEIGKATSKEAMLQKANADKAKFLEFYRGELTARFDYPFPELGSINY